MWAILRATSLAPGRRAWPIVWLILVAAGCSGSGAGGWGLVSRDRYDSLQTQNRSLAERARAQQTEIENLRLHSRSVEDQLIRAEEDLARLDDNSHRQQQKLANFKRERDELDDRYGKRQLGANTIPPALSGRLSDLADRYPSLHYDPKSGISKFDTDVLFDSGEADLTPSARRMLGEFADIFQSPEARDLKIMVVGHTDGRGIKGREARQKYPNNWHLSTARAVAVVERLREAGLPESRMGVAGFAQHQPISPNDTASAEEEPPGGNFRRRPRNAGRRLDRDVEQRLSVSGNSEVGSGKWEVGGAASAPLPRHREFDPSPFRLPHSQFRIRSGKGIAF